MENQFERTDAEFETRNSINKKRSGGRPKLQFNQRRRWQIKVGYNDADFSVIKAKAEKAGLSEIDYIRRASLNLKINTISQLNKDCLVQLNRIGNNVNQIAKLANVNPQSHAIAESTALMLSQIQALAMRIGAPYGHR